jgi:ribonuclease-3
MPSTTSSHGSEAEPDPPGGLPDALGYRFDTPELLRLALRHRSWCAENGGLESNERLEFLGDSVLGLVITDHLYRTYPDQPEGVLAQRRAELVSTVMLADVARELDLGSDIRLGRGEEATGGRDKPSILADALEAFFGAVYLDGGFDAATILIVSLFRERICDVAAEEFTTDHKSRLQELAAHRYGQLPEYELAGSGPEHAKTFTASVTVNGCVWGTGEGRTKKQAEQHAAEVAYDRLADTTDCCEKITAPNGDQDA